MDLQKAAMKPRPFPYRLERFEGQFHHSGGVVQWDRCRVQHGATTIECSGEIKPTVAGGGTLILRDVRCDGLPFDHDLRQAMPKDFVPIFDFISPDRRSHFTLISLRCGGLMTRHDQPPLHSRAILRLIGVG